MTMLSQTKTFLPVPTLRLDQFWVVNRVIPATNKTAKTIISKWDGPKTIRHALPEGIAQFTAIHVEKDIRIAQHMIKCKGGESPYEKTRRIAEKLGCLMGISEWKAVDDQIVIQVRRAAFVEVAFHLGDLCEHAWQQVNANHKHREKSAL
jgi:hypothetical protein